MLVNCVLYTNGKKNKEISVAEIDASLNQENSFVWVAFADPTPEELNLIQKEFHLHPLTIEDAQKGHQRPKLEEYDEIIFVVLKVPQIRHGELIFGEINIFVGPTFVISIRKNVEVGFHKVRERCELEPHLLKLGSGFVFYALIDNIIDRYYPVVESLEDQLEQIEENIFVSQANRKELEDLYLLKQKTTQLKYIIISSLDFVGKLFGGRVPKICIPLQEYYRDVFDHLMRVHQAVDSIRETIVTAMQVNLNLISMSESEVTKKLASWAALIGLPTMIAGIYGMNFRHMPELEQPWAYPLVLLVMIGGDMILYRRFKKTKWI